MTSEMKNNSVIGMARNSMLIGSVEGVATAANTNVPTTIQGRTSPSWRPLDHAGEIEQQDEHRDLERHAEDKQHAQDEVQIAAELDQVRDVGRG
jgi:hypothetical protein